MNKPMEYPNDSKRFIEVLDLLGLTARRLGLDVGYKSESGLYRLKQGQRPFSAQTARKIVTRFPHLSYKYLIGDGGKLEITGEKQKNQTNIIIAHNALKEQDAMELLQKMYKATMEVKVQNAEILRLLKGVKP